MQKVYLNIGSNIDKHRNILSGLQCLKERFGSVLISSVYESDPVGFVGESFFNLAALIETDLQLKELSDFLKKIEDTHGRNREDKNFKGRTLDIDIVLYGDLKGTVEGITLPRPELYYHGFVLKPMAELAGQLIDIKTGKSYAKMWEEESLVNTEDLRVVSLSESVS